MTPSTLSSPRAIRQQASPQQLVTRHNAVMFYAIAAASLLETGISLRAGALAAAFAPDAEFRAWFEDTWIPAKSAHARRARAYVEAMWPEFDWSAACDEFSADYQRLAPGVRSNCGIARVALSCSMAAAQAVVFYRGLGAAADDPELRHLLQDMAADEVAHFDRFRRGYEGHRRRERLGMLASFRTMVSCASRARDVDVHLAFSRLNGHHWYGGPPLQDLSYGEFVARMGHVVRRHLPLGPAQRLLFKPWLSSRDLPAAPAASSSRPVSTQRLDASRLAAGV